MKISSGKQVGIEYTLTLDDGEVADSNVDSGPLEFEFGSGQIISGLEAGLEGLEAGDTAQVEVAPADAYGEINEEAIVTVERNLIQGEGLDVGLSIQSQNETGQVFNGVITELDDESVTIDFNHPMAGKTLHFDVTVVSVQ